jgi:hypothetical protein
MKHWQASWITALSGVVVAAVLPLAAHWARQHSQGGCALDGVPIHPNFRVEVVDHEGRTHVFCCVSCAESWLNAQPGLPQAILVTDEVSGQPVENAKAFFVRSSVVTPTGEKPPRLTPANNRIHVFRNWADAEKHIGTEEHRGTLLEEADRPFWWTERSADVAGTGPLTPQPRGYNQKR